MAKPAAFLSAFLLVGATVAQAQHSAGSVQKSLAAEGTKLTAFGYDEILIKAVKAQNQRKIRLTQILQIDREWISGTRQALVKEITTGPCAEHLRQIVAKNPAYSETFVMDDQGALVCATSKTSDYWQGDEAKWQRPFQGGAGTVFIDRPRSDDSAKATLAQISVPIIGDGKPIGVITVGLVINRLRH